MQEIGYVATIGMFDGVHCGHQFVLQHVVDEARQRGLQSMAITFDKSGPQTLTPLDQKRLLLTKTGIDRIEVLTFNDALKQMTAREFMQQELRDRLGVKVLLTGYDNRFGHNRTEGFDDYVRYGQELGIEVLQLPQKGEISSSIIRQLVAEGAISKANQLLGNPYTILGSVEHGEHIGTKLGYPTANLVLVDDCQLIPATGVYAVKIRMENSVEWKHGMMNIGMRPTFDGQSQTLEVNVFRLKENLYGQQLQVAFFERLRGEQRFDNIEALKAQLQQDAIEAERILA
ncbi:MAG: riboflavin biosynthesis protein RibF [Prevotella sp.]|nr:riboflavin biosynthesis protein RibF [Prevotella sp.]MBR1881357.1 riboflavin biosynthesis protein RibF [Prevotella sp.]